MTGDEFLERLRKVLDKTDSDISRSAKRDATAADVAITLAAQLVSLSIRNAFPELSYAGQEAGNE